MSFCIVGNIDLNDLCLQLFLYPFYCLALLVACVVFVVRISFFSQCGDGLCVFVTVICCRYGARRALLALLLLSLLLLSLAVLVVGVVLFCCRCCCCKCLFVVIVAVALFVVVACC